MLAINQETQTAPFPAEIRAETGTRGPWGGLLRGSAGGAELGTPCAPTIEGSHPCPSRRSPKAPRPEAGAAHSHAPNAARSQISPP